MVTGHTMNDVECFKRWNLRIKRDKVLKLVFLVVEYLRNFKKLF